MLTLQQRIVGVKRISDEWKSGYIVSDDVIINYFVYRIGDKNLEMWISVQID